ncbi:hypothetical protein ACFVZH_38095 [Streptomyces sp. NPDC059534]|uniref:hypothetical protein n=1 Tax=Streptomyces sp. NPDC059534 TaxID=3346859 RepID=UPI003693E3BD
MAKSDEPTPQEWREILANFRYPDHVNEVPRSKRGGAKRAHRDAVRRNTTEWVREQRRREPLRPAGAAIILALILALGAGARWVWPGLLGDEAATQVTTTAAPSPQGPDDKPSAPAPPASSPSPSTSPTPSINLNDPERVAEEALRLYLARNPPIDKSHRAAVLRAAPYMSASLVENLTASSDPAWDRLVSRGGVSTVRTVKVEPAGADLPRDTPLRVWRKTTATVDIEGYTTYTETTTLQVELMLTDTDEWRITRILGL